MEKRGRFDGLLLETGRRGIENVLAELERLGFYEAPASTRFHLMADVELACKFYGEVSKSLKRYSITFVDSRVALAAYMNKRFGKESDFCQISPRAASMR